MKAVVNKSIKHQLNTRTRTGNMHATTAAHVAIPPSLAAPSEWTARPQIRRLNWEESLDMLERSRSAVRAFKRVAPQRARGMPAEEGASAAVGQVTAASILAELRAEVLGGRPRLEGRFHMLLALKVVTQVAHLAIKLQVSCDALRNAASRLNGRSFVFDTFYTDERHNVEVEVDVREDKIVYKKHVLVPFDIVGHHRAVTGNTVRGVPEDKRLWRLMPRGWQIGCVLLWGALYADANTAYTVSEIDRDVMAKFYLAKRHADSKLRKLSCPGKAWVGPMIVFTSSLSRFMRHSAQAKRWVLF
jgi:hypothetical protein